MATLCDICGRPLPYQRLGRPRRRHRGACERADLLRRHRENQARWTLVTGRAQDDDPPEVIEAKYRARLEEIRREGVFEVDGWAQPARESAQGAA